MKIEEIEKENPVKIINEIMKRIDKTEKKKEESKYSNTYKNK